MAYQEGEVEFPADSRPGAPLFERWVLCENRLSGTIDGATAAMFDLTTVHFASGDERNRLWTVIVFSQSNLPAFLCIPRSWSTLPDRLTFTSISFDPREADQFTRRGCHRLPERLHVGSGQNGDRIRGKRGPTSFLRTTTAGDGGTPRVARPVGRRVSGLGARRDCTGNGETRTLARSRRIPPGGQWRRCLTPSPPSPRSRGWMWAASAAAARVGDIGVFAGGAAGFFGSGVAVATTLVSRMGPHGAGLRPETVSTRGLVAFGLVAAGFVVGAVTGSWLGGRVADLAYIEKECE